MRPLRPLLAAGIAATLVAVPGVASADVDQFVTQADTTAVRISVFEAAVGSSLLELGSTLARGESGPLASADVTAVTLLGEELVPGAEASSDRERAVDPSEGDGCTAPSIDVEGLSVDVVCVRASARGGPAGQTQNMDALADITVGEIGVGGDLLAGLLSGAVGDLVDGLLAEAGAEAIDEGLAEFATACQGVIDGLPAESDPTDEVPEQVGELLALTGADLDEAVDVLADQADTICLDLLDLDAAALVAPVVDTTALEEALAGLELLDLTVSASTSRVDGTATSLTALGEQTILDISGPSLDAVDDLVEALAGTGVDALGTAVNDLTGTDVIGEAGLEEILSEVLAQIPLLDDSSPLVSATVSGGAASASIDLAGEGVTASGDLPFVQVAIAPSVLALFGQDPSMGTMTFEAGETMTIAEGTPLESTVSVGDSTLDEAATDEATGLAGIRATTSVTTLSLLTPNEGGVVIALGESRAGAFGASAPVGAGAPEPQQLPRTGGGAALGALAAIGAAVVLSRRRRT